MKSPFFHVKPALYLENAPLGGGDQRHPKTRPTRGYFTQTYISLNLSESKLSRGIAAI